MGRGDNQRAVGMTEVMNDLRASAASGGATMEQIKTAYHTAVRVQVPRDLKVATERMKAEMALAGSDAYYYWTVKQINKQTGKEERVPITGPSIDGTMILVRNYGNCALEIGVQIEDPSHWLLCASFIDLECGFTLQRLYRQRKSERHGKYDSDRALDIAFQIGQSKALRNVVKAAMPVGFLRVGMESAHEAAASKYANLEHYKPLFVRKFKAMGVTQDQLELKLDKPFSEWNAMDLADLEALGRAIKDGETTLENEFGEPQAAASQSAAAAPAQSARTAAQPDPGPSLDDMVKQGVKYAQEAAEKLMDSAVRTPAPAPAAPPSPPVVAAPVQPPVVAPSAPPAPEQEQLGDKLARQAREFEEKQRARLEEQRAAQAAAPPTPPVDDGFPGSWSSAHTPAAAPVPPAPPTPPAPVPPPAAPAQPSAPVPDSEQPLWARNILASPTIRAMNAAVIDAVKKGIGKADIEPFSARRRAELETIMKGQPSS